MGWRGRLRAAWVAWRNRRLMSPAFQRAAMDVPIVRGVARGEAAALFDTVAGFVYAQILRAFLELGWPALLAARRLTAGEVAAASGLPEAAAMRLLRAAAALRLAERVGERWTLGTRGAALLGNPGVAEMVAHHALLYRDLADPVALLRRGGGGGALAGLWGYAGARTPDDAAAYSALMAASQPLVARQILDAYGFDRHRHLMDVGGGDGAFLEAAGARAPRLQLTLFDLAAVAPHAEARLGARARVVAGDFRHDALPVGADLATLVRVLHDHDDAAACALLRACRAALPPGGTLLVGEPMAGTPGAAAMGDAYFGMYLWAMGAGRPRTPAEIGAMLRAAGFVRARLWPTRTPLTARVVTAQVPHK